MPFLASRDVLRRRADVALIGIFFALIWLPTADSFLRLDHSPTPNENRALAPSPKFQPTLAGVRTFFAGAESYFNDHFGFRRKLVRLEHHLRWQIYREGRPGNALTGKDGWLFLSWGRMIDDVKGSWPFSEAELEDWRRLLTGRRDWLAARGIRYLFVVPPDKHSVYPEHLPGWLAVAARDRRRIGQLMEYMRKHSDVPVLDLHDTMLAAKKRGIIYRQTDTHWNALGALAASCEIVRTAASLGIPVRPLDEAAYEIARAELGEGDLVWVLGSGRRFQDSGDLILKQVVPSAPFELQTKPGALPKSSNPKFGITATSNPSAAATAVIFHDSFGVTCFEFLAQSFQHVTCVRAQNWDKRVFGMVKPDIVIDEMLEQYVISLDPNLAREMDDQPFELLLGGDAQ